jgi:hypothetical protein
MSDWRYRQWLVSYTIPGQCLQKIIVTADGINAAREIVKAMFGGKAIIGYIEEK